MRNCSKGEVHEINDLVTLNLDIWQFARDAIVNAEGPELLRAFWHAIAGRMPEKSNEKIEPGITILDPTCGSGAFLFAALRILETLYSDCLERMEWFVEEADAGSGTGVPPVFHGQDAHATGLNPLVKVNIRHGAYLPHWTQQDATYAVSFRLYDSLSAEVLKQWIAERDDIVKTARQLGRELTDTERERLAHLYSEKVEKWLDAGHGACWLKDPRIAQIVSGALAHFDDERYDLLAWCIMPNHVHAILRPKPEHELSAIMHSWKSFSAKQANKTLNRNGEFWQAEYYDHLIRDESDFRRQVEYILDNPAKAGLQEWRWVGGSGTGVSPVNHGQDGHATPSHGQDGRATKKYQDFRDILAQIGKHPNERYFILKSIIINNLFGVDIMEEAVEICKLRLFLKLVAQVETVDQIEPLPDIDFNIRAGNTLVGFALSLNKSSKSQERHARFRQGPDRARIEEDAELVDRAFQQFRAQQTTHGGRVTAKDKQQLLTRLTKLDHELDRYLAGEYGVRDTGVPPVNHGQDAHATPESPEFRAWKISHQPFHWFVEFYGIMHAGGFDVIDR